MTELDDLRGAYRRSSGGNQTDHPSDDQWERLACGELDASERWRIVEHVLDCARCSDMYRALGIVRSEASAFDEAVPESLGIAIESARARWVSWRGLGILAVAATAIIAVVVPLSRDRVSPVDGGAVVVRSAGDGPAVVAVAPLGEVGWNPGEAVTMSWSRGSLEGPAVVEVLDADGEPAWTSGAAEGSEVVWPAEQVPGPGRYYWRVSIRGQSSENEASDLVSFDLVSASPP